MTVMQSSVTIMGHVKMGQTLSFVTVQKGSLVPNVRQMLMTVMESSVTIMGHVKIGQTLSLVIVQKDSLVSSVR